MTLLPMDVISVLQLKVKHFKYQVSNRITDGHNIYEKLRN